MGTKWSTLGFFWIDEELTIRPVKKSRVSKSEIRLRITSEQSLTNLMEIRESDDHPEWPKMT